MRWWKAFLVSVLCVLLVGGSVSAVAQGVSMSTRVVAGRTYLAVRAESAHSGLPLLVVLHGRGMDVRNMATRTGFLRFAENGLADVVYPAGIGQSWNAGSGCCGLAARRHVDDTAFVQAVVADATRAFGTDPRRTYLVGYSNGGRLAFHLACVSPATFAAFATYGAAPPTTCANRAAAGLSALVAAGTADRILQHGAQVVRQATTTWRALNSCPAHSSTRRTGPAVVTTWRGCHGGAAVQSIVFPGLTHAWPSSVAGLMWNFLSRQVGRGTGVSAVSAR
ncbi:alpha/beta hydrolase family esterase [Amycolatopsis tucumanensis]|uniref:alpha/beta hydrolase family esterase n=1 Tax=Amycolatopsis tucumanensis TaxID=401106 RepID=UPI003D7414A5